MKRVYGTQGLVREIEIIERLGVREIGSKFALLYREKKRDRSFTSRDRELREIGVRAIESHLYIHNMCTENREDKRPLSINCTNYDVYALAM